MILKWCCGCNYEKPVDEFYRTKRAKDGRQSRCKICMRSAYTTTRNKKKDHYNSVARERIKTVKDRWRDWKELKGCTFCTEAYGPCLQLHHTDPNNKDDAVANLIQKGVSWEEVMKEATKGIIVCGNCHVKIHYGVIQL